MASARTNSLWWNRRAIGLHVTVAITVPGFLALGWWQLNRALGGNGLSWAYTFEWPFFAGYAVYLWWRLVHEPPAATTETEAAELTTASAEPQPEDDALAAYNAHLAALHAADEERHLASSERRRAKATRQGRD